MKLPRIRQAKLLKRTVITVVVLILSGLLPVSFPKAQANTTLAIFPAQSEVPLASQAVIGLEVRNGVEVNSFDVVIEYDPEFLRLDGWRNGDYLSDLAVVKKVDESGYFWLVCTQISGEPVSGNGILIELFFYARVLGTTDISIEYAEFSDGDGDLSEPDLAGGSVNIAYASTYTHTATGTNTPEFSPTSTLSSTPTSPASSTGTPPTRTASPTRTPTIVTPTPTRFPTRASGSITPEPGPTEILTPSQTEVPTQIPPTPTDSYQTQIARLSATPIFATGSIEGSDPGPVKIPSGGVRIDIQTWIWVGIGLVLLAGFILVILAVRRRKHRIDQYPYD